MGLAFSGSHKPEFNLPFSCYLGLLFYAVGLTRPLPSLLDAATLEKGWAYQGP